MLNALLELFIDIFELNRGAAQQRAIELKMMIAKMNELSTNQLQALFLFLVKLAEFLEFQIWEK